MPGWFNASPLGGGLPRLGRRSRGSSPRWPDPAVHLSSFQWTRHGLRIFTTTCSAGSAGFRYSSTAILRSFNPRVRNFLFRDYGYFFQDDWRLNPRLTLNLGLRWEFFGVPRERDSLGETGGADQLREPDLRPDDPNVERTGSPTTGITLRHDSAFPGSCRQRKDGPARQLRTVL